MNHIDQMLIAVDHRPFPIPDAPWKYYQEWNRVVFFHWEVSFHELRKCVPDFFSIDSFDGKYYVSMVAFTMEKIRPGFLPSWSALSNFHEVNLRTYIENDNKKGVYFLSIEAGKLISTVVARALSDLPYERASIQRTQNKYSSRNVKRNYFLEAEYNVGQPAKDQSALDKWLIERYCLYFDHGKNFYRYDIHHLEWQLRKVQTVRVDIKYEVGAINLEGRPPGLVHYSDGIKVVAWGRKRLG